MLPWLSLIWVCISLAKAEQTRRKTIGCPQFLGHRLPSIFLKCPFPHHLRPTSIKCLITLSLWKEFEGAFVGSQGPIRGVTVRLEVRMNKCDDTFPPESAQSQHKVSTTSQNWAFFTRPLTKWDLFHVSAGGRHNCSISRNASLALSRFCQNFNSFTGPWSRPRKTSTLSSKLNQSF